MGLGLGRVCTYHCGNKDYGSSARITDDAVRKNHEGHDFWYGACGKSSSHLCRRLLGLPRVYSESVSVGGLVCICGHRVTHGGLNLRITFLATELSCWLRDEASAPASILGSFTSSGLGKKFWRRSDDPLKPSHLPLNTSWLTAFFLPGEL